MSIPKEPAPNGPIYVHVPWASDTLPWVTVGFPGPAFDEASKDSAAMDILASIFFGQTSDLYKQLVVTEQKVDELDVDVPASFDPSLFTVLARVKNSADCRLRPRSDSVGRGASHGRRWCRPSGWRTRSRSIATRLPAASTAPSASPPSSRGTPSYQRSYADGQQLLPHAGVADARRSAGRRAQVLRRRRPDRDDAVHAIRCRPASNARRSLRSTRRRRSSETQTRGPGVGADRAERRAAACCRSRCCRSST